MERVKLIAIARHRLGIDGEGVTTLVALHGCPLRCKYCLNPQCNDPNFKWRSMTAQEVVDECMKDNIYFLATGGGITVGGGDPLLHPQFIQELRSAMPSEWKLNIETSLNIPTQNITQIINQIDHWIIDIKDIDPNIYKEYTECTNERVIENLKLLSSQGLQDKCTIRIPLIPNHNNPDNQASSRKRLEEFGFCHFDIFEYVTQEEK